MEVLAGTATELRPALPGAAVLFNYPIDERRHAEIRRQLAERQAGEAA